MERLKIIRSERALKQQISLMPELKDNQAYFMMLMARGKYNTSENKIPDTVSLNRTVIKRKNDFFNKVKRYELEKGVFTFNGQTIDDSLMVVYYKPNPRDLVLANYDTQMKILQEQKKHYRDSNYKIGDPERIALNAIQEASTKGILNIDFDIVDHVNFIERYFFESLEKHIGFENIRQIIRTKGGYHIHADMTSPRNKNWVKELRGEVNSCVMELVTDSFSPLAGTTQGGYSPTLMFFQYKGVILATSDFWKNFSEINILEPDGWDRGDYTWSFYEELITLDEFEKRRMLSTVMFVKSFSDNINFNDWDKVKSHTMDELAGEEFEGYFNDYIKFKNEL